MENQIIEQDNIKYKIKEDQNASFVVGIKSDLKEIFIPRSIKYKTKEYDVLGILKGAFNFSGIKSLQFANDSKLQSIHKDAFYLSQIKSIQIPTELTELEEGWCNYTLWLSKIEVSPKCKC